MSKGTVARYYVCVITILACSLHFMVLKRNIVTFQKSTCVCCLAAMGF